MRESALIPAAVQEALRLVSLVQFLRHWRVRPVSFHCPRMAAGDTVIVLTGSLLLRGFHHLCLEQHA